MTLAERIDAAKSRARELPRMSSSRVAAMHHLAEAAAAARRAESRLAAAEEILAGEATLSETHGTTTVR